MPYLCKFCKGRYCAAHRLPENHGCQGLGAYREKIRQEGRILGPIPGEEPVAPSVSPTARASASMDALWARVDGKMTYVLLGVIIAVFVIEWIVYAAAGEAVFLAIFAISLDFVTKPWTIVTSIFSHDPFNVMHVFLNSIVLLFFGQSVERLIGTKRFTYLFLGAGAIAGVAEVLFMKLLFNANVSALGASGALQGVLGTLVVLAPTLTVLVFFVIPAPLWALAILYVLLDVAGVLSGGTGVANVAHLAGLAVGLAYGYSLRRKGLRAVVRKSPPMWSR